MPELQEDAQVKEAKANFSVFSAEEITFAFDTVFIVRKTVEKSLEPLRAYLNGIGDSLVIGEDDEAFKVHVHTNVPGSALSEAQKYGTLELAKIENMRTQYDDVAAGKQAQSVDDLETLRKPAEAAARRGRLRPRRSLVFWRSAPATGLPDCSGIWECRRRGVRRPDHESLHPEHSGRSYKIHSGRNRLRAAQQQKHHHGRSAVRTR
jgi:hypothetical protein